jgi:hypothetical protein
MKITSFNRRSEGSEQTFSRWAAGRGWTLALLLLATVDVRAGVQNGVVAGSVCGGGSVPFSGYLEGNPYTGTDAKFNYPSGLAMDSGAAYLFVADYLNNAVRAIDLSSTPPPSNHSYFTYTFAPMAGVTDGTINRPVGVALDTSDNVYVLNRGNGMNGSVVVFDQYGLSFTNLVSGLTNANAIALDLDANVYVTAGNCLLKIAWDGTRTNVATVTNSGAFLQGLVVMDTGMIAACDAGRHGILLINPTNGVITNLTGFNGAGDNNTIWQNAPNPPVGKSLAKFNQPSGLAKAGNNMLIVADYGNNRVKVVDAAGSVTNLYGVNSSLWCANCNPHGCPGTWAGWADGQVTVPDACGDVEARLPNGVLFAPDGTVYISEDYYHLIRMVTGANLPPVPPPPPPPPGAPTIILVLTNYGQVSLAWSSVGGATSYNVKRSPSDGGPYTTISSASGTNYMDTAVINGTTYYYVVSAVGAGGEGPNSAQVSARPPLPPVPDPRIGYVDFPQPNYVSVFHQFSSFVAYNDLDLVIKGTPGSSTWYTYGYTTNAAAVDNPTTNSASIPSDYQDGLFANQVHPYLVSQIAPYVTIKTIGTKSDGSPDSALVTSLVQFVTGNPNINGNNAAQFTISDITANAHLYYTLDGSDPSGTNVNAVDLGTLATPTDVWNVSFPIFTNTWFKARAFHANYQPSGIVSNYFSPTNMVANTISFGFAAGEASSDFIGSAGQYFYAPVTLTPLPNTAIYSMQFNLTVTNAGPLPGPAVASGAYAFQSFLEKPIPGVTPVLYERIPPLMFAAYAANPPPASATVTYDGMPFVNMVFADTTINLLGVGWLERAGKTNLYDTTKQSLITFSQAHDTLFSPDMGKVVLGGYAFQVPPIATPGQTYQIQVARPSATADGVGTPSASVYIATPTNGSLAAGPINSVKLVTVGQRKYTAGDCAPFRWFNAGDFGNTNLDNSDVEQVFQSAIYSLNNPPANSDFFDSMDSCGGTYVDLGHGYLEFGSFISGAAALNPLFDGNDTSINQIAFGDGTLDVCDVYVTFRRSLDPSLNWFRRFWTNGVRGAEILFPQPKRLSPLKDGAPAKNDITSSLTNQPFANFAATDVVASPGQTIQVPITAKIFGDYPLRVLMLNVSVVPLDGSPALTSAVQFVPNAALGMPSLTSSTGNGNYAAAWLNSTIAGLSGTATVGTLTVTIPSSASSSAAYAIHFDHASASPNGVAAFPKQILTGLITLSSRNSSSYGDGIPDSWRLRWFGTIYNALTVSNADACGDGINNWQKYVAGTDPTDAKAYPRLKTRNPAPPGATAAIHWPSVSGKQYLIERSASLFPGSWTAIATNTGTGTEMEFDDSTGASTRFYRVRILP